MDPLTPRPRLLSLTALAERGVSRRRREYFLRDGALRRIRRGTYIAAADVPDGIDAQEQQLLLRTRATAPSLHPGTVVSHASALVLHGLPVFDLDTGVVTTTRHRPGSGTRRSTSSVQYSAELTGAVVAVDGIPVTAIARSIVDVARAGRFTGALCAADAALARSLCSRSDLQREVAAARGKVGVEIARGVVDFADGRAESVFESVSRVAIHRLGLPAPIPQVELRLSSGRTVRVDLFWKRWNLIGECDGLGKYGITGGSSRVRASLAAEKDRQSDLEADGFRLVRWRWPDAQEPARLERLIRAGIHLQERAGLGSAEDLRT